MPPYSGDKKMDPITQLRILYKRKGIPLSPFGWFVVFCVICVVGYNLYKVAHVNEQIANVGGVDVLKVEKSNVNDNVILKDVNEPTSAKEGNLIEGNVHEQVKDEDKVKERQHDKLINDLGESGLAGGQVFGKLKGRETEKPALTVSLHGANKSNDKAIIVESSRNSAIRKEKEKSPDVEKDVLVLKSNNNNNRRKAHKDKVIKEGRKRVTLDPIEFGGQNVEIMDNMDQVVNNEHLPQIPLFERDDKLVPKAHLEHIPKPDPKSYNVRHIEEPEFENCKTNRLIILVTSEIMNTELRTGIRSTWYSPENYRKFKNDTNAWRVIFILGRSYDYYDERVKMEAEENGDILQGDFKDSEYEETRKTLIATKFLAEEYKCKPKFVLKTRDNIFLNMISIMGWMDAKFKTASKLYVGNFLHRDQPIRDWTHPLYVSPNDYPKKFFPDMIKGPVYLFSMDVVTSMTRLYKLQTPIAMEDGYIGLLMEKLKVKPRHNEHFWLLGKHGNKCNYLRMFFVQNVKPLDHIRLMQSNKLARKSRECLKAQHYDRRVGKFIDDENPY